MAERWVTRSGLAAGVCTLPVTGGEFQLEEMVPQCRDTEEYAHLGEPSKLSHEGSQGNIHSIGAFTLIDTRRPCPWLIKVWSALLMPLGNWFVHISSTAHLSLVGSCNLNVYLFTYNEKYNSFRPKFLVMAAQIVFWPRLEPQGKVNSEVWVRKRRICYTVGVSSGITWPIHLDSSSSMALSGSGSLSTRWYSEGLEFTPEILLFSYFYIWVVPPLVGLLIYTNLYYLYRFADIVTWLAAKYFWTWKSSHHFKEILLICALT